MGLGLDSILMKVHDKVCHGWNADDHRSALDNVSVGSLLIKAHDGNVRTGTPLVLGLVWII